MKAADDFRLTQPPQSVEHLTAHGAQWLKSLPVPVRPLITAKRHPHIVNKLAILWGHTADLERYMTELLVSSRPNRRGFAPEVLEELLDMQRALQEHGGR